MERSRRPRNPQMFEADLMQMAKNNIGQAETMPGEQVQGNEDMVGFVPVERVVEKRMNKERLTKAMKDLADYKAGKAHLESRIVEVEQWWKIRHWEWMQEQGARNDIKTASAWLFNVIISKHADGIQSIPEANILPREEGDKPTAKMLSSIIP